jgi:DNA-binding MarR family transcriptional regulator
MSDNDAQERRRLLDEIGDAQQALETSSLTAFLEPLLELDLTIQQLRVLAILVAGSETSTGQGLARMLGVSLATISGIVDRLEAHGMLERVVDPDDQRVRRLVPTGQGRETIQQLLVAQSRASLAPLERLDVNDLRALARGLRAIIDASSTIP